MGRLSGMHSVLDVWMLMGHRILSLRFTWCPCMAINVSIQYNGGFLPDITLLTLCGYIEEPD